VNEEPDDRPRWSINWGLRIQRIGRNRRERELDGTQASRERMRIRLGYAVLGLVLLIEIAIGMWIGILPR